MPQNIKKKIFLKKYVSCASVPLPGEKNGKTFGMRSNIAPTNVKRIKNFWY